MLFAASHWAEEMALHCRILLHECSRTCKSSCIVDKFAIFLVCSRPFGDMSDQVHRATSNNESRPPRKTRRLTSNVHAGMQNERLIVVEMLPTCPWQFGVQFAVFGEFSLNFENRNLNVVGEFVALMSPTLLVCFRILRDILGTCTPNGQDY